jgi:putative thioredoxin
MDVKPNPYVVNVTDQTFSTAVLEESRRRPVVVDFWAGWCQPCRQIGPVLERLAAESRGEFLLAKVDVDANPRLSQAFRVQSIPAVKAFRDAAVVNEFLGVIPEPSIRQFIRSVVPSRADRLVIEGEQAETRGLVEEAAKLYDQALADDPRHVGAGVGKGRLAATRGDYEEARALLAPWRPDPEAERLLAAIEVSEWAEPDGDSAAGALAEATRAAAEGRFDQALASFLAEVKAGGDERDRARDAMLKVFAVLGDGDPLTRDYRRRLSAALF